MEGIKPDSVARQHRTPARKGIEPVGARPEPAETILELDTRARLLAAARDLLSLPLARAARSFRAQRGWATLGYARVHDYARERLARSGRWLRDLASLGEVLESFPALAEALTGGDGGRPLGRVAALAIGRVASPDSVGSWIAFSRTVTVRRLAESVAEARAAESTWPPGSRCEASRDDAGESAEPPGNPCETARDSAGESVTPPGGLSTGARDGTGELSGTSGDSEECDDTSPGGATTAGSASRCAAREQRAADRGEAADLEEAAGERHLVTLFVPMAVRAAFREGHELHKAVCGEETTVTAFVEALVGESLAGPYPPDADLAPLRPAPGRRAIEEMMARVTRCWSGLPNLDADASRAALDPCLRLLGSLCSRAGTGGPSELDGQLREAIEIEDEIERSLGAVLAKMADRGAWASLLFAGSGHYACERLGMARTTAEDRLSLQRLARRLPLLRQAYQEGRVGLQAALIVARMLNRMAVGSATEQAWVERASEATVKRLRDEIRAVALRGMGLDPEAAPSDRRGSAPGTGPQDPAADLAGPLSDEAWRDSVRRAPGDALRRITALGRAAATGLGVADSFLRLRLPEDLAADFLASVESSRRGLTELAESVPWDEPWPDPNPAAAVIAARTFSARCRRVPSWVGLLAMIENCAATWDDPDGMPVRPSDAVYVRDGWRCTAPGCSSRRNLEDHHVQYRSRGGSDDLSNRTCLCRFHHQQGEHGGLASCAGEAPLGLRWSLGKDGIGGKFLNEKRSDRPVPPGGMAARSGADSLVGILGAWR